MLAVVKIQGYFCRPLGTSLFRAGKDNIFRLLSPQVTYILFAHNPAHGIGNITFAAPVGADNGRNAMGKGQGCPVCKGFKSLQFHF